MQARLSVIMPNHNHGRFLAGAIEAIVSQSRRPDQYLIVDDGSTDDSVDIITAYAAKYPFITFLRNSRNLGFHQSARRAHSLAIGDYLYPCAADDRVLPGFFEKAMAGAELYPRAGLISGKWDQIDEDGRGLDQVVEVKEWGTARFVNPETFLDEYLLRYPPKHTFSLATIYERRSFDEVDGFREELGFYCDNFAIRTIARKYGLFYIPEIFARWRIMRNSLSHASVADPKQEYRIMLTAQELMRSVEFKSLFPARYVEKWAAEYRQEITGRLVSSWCGEISSAYWNSLPDRPIHRWILKRLNRRFHQHYRVFLRSVLIRALDRAVRTPHPSQ
jgi:glycosyltransferase involved in cell wall biosynthesis